MYSNHPPSKRSPYEYPQGYDSSQQGWPTPSKPYPPRYSTGDIEHQDDGTKPFANRSDYWFDHSTNPYSPPPTSHWPPVYQQQQQQQQQRPHAVQSPLQLPPTPSSTSSSTDISPHVDASKQPSGYPFPVTFQQQQQQSQQPPPTSTNHRTPHWRIPATERPFKCDNCPLSFNRNHDLKRHARIHLSVKPFPCNFCDKRFSRKDALKRHMLVKRCGQAQAKSIPSGTSAAATPSSYYDSRQDGSSQQTDSANSTNLFLPPPPVIRQSSSSSILHHHHHGLTSDAPSSAAYPI
ncbi:hypothetical protein INT44_004493 [Umbelopsis vinacea]|uniref:C2H2-type domain-containing protein n=1 Tax=Umbelopsis vinacea TaxID=44442 RepID=A0A8H7UKH6_9FUNG|nr:hypothetical protein INT44_004493 [Umbelopsis vinacea]